MENTEFYNGVVTINVKELSYLTRLTGNEINDIAIGPQESFLEKVDSINDEFTHRGIEKIDVTPKWNWRPGTYDKVKEYIYIKLDLHKKSKNCDYLLGRTRDRVNYLGYIHRQFQALEDERAYLKRMGVSRDVDIDEFKEKCLSFVQNIENQCQTVSTATDGKVSITPYLEIEGRKAIIYYHIILNDLEMSIYSGRDNSTRINTMKLEPIDIRISMNLRYLLSGRNQQFNAKGKYMSKYFKFPYISTNRYDRNDFDFGTVCLDKYSTEILSALNKSDFMVLAMNLMNWAQYYNTDYANPYNQPHYLHYGLPNNFSKEYKTLQSVSTVQRACKNVMYNRFNEISGWKFDNAVNKICNNIECSVKSTCELNSSIVNREVIWELKYDEIEGIIGIIIEYLSLTSDFDTIRYELENLTGVTLSTIQDENIHESAADLLSHYYCSRAQLYDSYLINWLEGKKLLEIPAKSLDTDELETLMKQWVDSQGGE